MRIALGQLNACVGDFEANAEKIRQIYARAAENNADLIIFPELAVCGYPPEDLLHKKHFLEDNRAVIDGLAAAVRGKVVVVGFAESNLHNRYNSAAVLDGGRISTVYRKALLPNYGVFDEQRYFNAGKEPVVFNCAGINVALTICRDIWDIDWLAGFLARTGPVDLIVNLSASPYHMGKTELRAEILSRCATRLNCAVAYCNLIGGQDELVFDGRSCFVNAAGQIIGTASAFKEDLLMADIARNDRTITLRPVEPPREQPSGLLDEVCQALTLGTRDYARKNGFDKVLVGLSGGIDSSVVACLAAAALSPQNVTGVTMPSKFNSPETIADVKKLAKNLGIRLLTIPIGPVLEQFSDSLKAVPGWDLAGVAYENLQARIRGTILMTLSNQFGSLVLTTGNKSETAVGYATLYGDTAGGFAVIKDVPKTLVYKLAEHINKANGKQIIPDSVLRRPPSAELREDQKDSDSLPDYDILDAILKGYVEEDKSARELAASGLPEDTLQRVISMVDRNEYKRRQSPPGVKITPKAFGKDRRLPITNRYRPR